MGLVLAPGVGPDVRAATLSTDLPALLQCMRDNVPQHGRIQDIEISTTAGGEDVRTFSARLFGRSDTGSLAMTLQVRAPADLKGAAWLFRRSAGREEAFVYLPAVGKVTRIGGGAGDQGLFGTALSFEDMRQVLTSFSGGAVSLGATGEIAGRPVRKLYVVARPDAVVGYDKIEAQVDLQTCAVLDAELYRDAELRKRLRAEPGSLRRFGRHWFASVVRFEDRRSGLRSELRILDAEVERAPPTRYFEPSLFFRD